MELFFEFLIRPSDYHEQIVSEDAYAPKTARHINRYHLVCESIALLLFIPQFPCIANSYCGARDPGSLRFAAIAAVLGGTSNVSSLGRFIIGLSFFRIFGLVRHWKNMWINDTFRGRTGPENCKLLVILLRRETCTSCCITNPN